MKKIVTLLLSAVLCFGMIDSVAMAEEEMVLENLSLDIENFKKPTGTDINIREKSTTNKSSISLFAKAPLTSTPVYDDWKEYTINQIKNHVEQISYNEPIPYEDFAEFVFECYFRYDLMIYADCSINTTKINNKTYITDCEFQYILSQEDSVKAVEMMDAEIAKYLEACKDAPDLLGKILIIHDKMCKDNAYAYEELKGNGTRLIYTAYGFFANKRAVCQGNSIAFKAICDALNEELKEENDTTEDFIETGLCYSDSINHIWNTVKIDGKWYYLDETWDNLTLIKYGNSVYMTGDIVDTLYAQKGLLKSATEEKKAGIQQIIDLCNTILNEGVRFNYANHDNFLVPEEQMANHLSGSSDSFSLWGYFYYYDIECDDDKYLSGYIFNGKNTVGYIGNISFENNRYKIEKYATTQPFWSTTVTSLGVVTTDVFVKDNKNTIGVLMNQDIDEGLYIPEVISRINGSIENVGLITTEKATGALTAQIPIKDGVNKVFIWENSTLRPLTKMIQINN